ncbi:MAG: glycyl-radical enzyme activating protein [Erysipelotrichaceae bacterium]|nr:glycyl-radical enzyme activating protein [Erysipelotrichaceae bacterium]
MAMDNVGLISNIQRYSLHDGPGIRTTVFMMGCPLRCAWCSNPESLKKVKQLMIFDQKCTLCGECVRVEPEAISIDGKLSVNRVLIRDIEHLAQSCPYDVFEIIGREMSVEELVEECMKDEPFYRNSGGGVTFSGGDPIMQADFLVDVTRRLREKGIHVALDTSGGLPWDEWKVLASEVDLVLYDLKLFDEEKHIEFTQSGNSVIFDNLDHLAMLGKELIVRMVVIEGINDDRNDIKLRCERLKQSGANVSRIELLPYHTLGRGKYIRLGLTYPLKQRINENVRTIEELKSLIESLGFSV